MSGLLLSRLAKLLDILAATVGLFSEVLPYLQDTALALTDCLFFSSVESVLQTRLMIWSKTTPTAALFSCMCWLTIPLSGITGIPVKRALRRSDWNITNHS